MAVSDRFLRRPKQLNTIYGFVDTIWLQLLLERIQSVTEITHRNEDDLDPRGAHEMNYSSRNTVGVMPVSPEQTETIQIDSP